MGYCSSFGDLKPRSLVLLLQESQRSGPCHFFYPYLALLSYTAGLQPSAYLNSSIRLTVLLVNLIYGLVAFVMTILHIIAELKKTEK